MAAIRRVTVDHAELIKFLTEQHCPRDSGFMAENVEIHYTRDQMTSEVGWDEENFIANSPTKRFYPIYVEFGTSRNAAQPSLFPAMEQARPYYEQNLRDALRAAIRRRSGLERT